MLEVRKIIEVGAAASAAIHRTEEDIQSMMQILNEMKRVQGDGELGEKVDFQFHAAISAASKTPTDNYIGPGFRFNDRNDERDTPNLVVL